MCCISGGWSAVVQRGEGGVDMSEMVVALKSREECFLVSARCHVCDGVGKRVILEY